MASPMRSPSGSASFRDAVLAHVGPRVMLVMCSTFGSRHLIQQRPTQLIQPIPMPWCEIPPLETRVWYWTTNLHGRFHRTGHLGSELREWHRISRLCGEFASGGGDAGPWPGGIASFGAIATNAHKIVHLTTCRGGARAAVPRLGDRCPAIGHDLPELKVPLHDATPCQHLCSAWRLHSWIPQNGWDRLGSSIKRDRSGYWVIWESRSSKSVWPFNRWVTTDTFIFQLKGQQRFPNGIIWYDVCRWQISVLNS